ncbi:MAG: HAMP domain-containing histidine kinase [Lachnospiraceae bacterium]|nr:HAMP domain-containing histidine kinase [Lachnospiraceae bacterium]
MKRLSIGTKITIWFSLMLLAVVALTYWIIITISGGVLQKTVRDNLIEAVEHNVDEIEFYSDINDMEIMNSMDYYVQYGTGVLEVDDDFLDEVNEVYTSLCKSDNELMYGENPIIREANEFEFSDSVIQKVTVDGVLYYIYDRKLTYEGLEDLWLRGVVSEEQGDLQLASITKTSLVLLPLLNLIAILGGYIIARRMLRPIKYISDTAAEISQGVDLKKRIDIGKGKDEIHKLADNFNNMFDRLDKSFQTEKQFTSDVSHELRTPMSVIMAQCELALEDSQTNEEYKEALETIYRQGGKMSRLINDMLDFTRLELNTGKYVKENTDMSGLTESVCLDMMLIKENGITLQCDVCDNIFINGNRELLTRLLTNLISNAYRYGKQDGNIWVNLAEDEENIVLSVKDDGIGIEPEAQEKIFKRFYQADSSRHGEGTGLGLSMVKEIAAFHGGTVAVESKLGEGATFICKFEKN